MKKIPFLLAFLASALWCEGQHAEFAADRLIVKFKEAPVVSSGKQNAFPVTGITEVDQLNEKYGCTSSSQLFTGKQKDNLPPFLQNIFVLSFRTARDIPSLINEYMATGAFEYAEPDYKGGAHGQQVLTPNDTYFASRQWGLKNSGSFPDYPKPSKAGADIDAVLAWNIATGDTGVVVAIIDSGARLNHPEFSGRIWTNYDETDNNGTDDDGNGKIDDRYGWDFANNDKDPTDDQGHGSNVAGIIGVNGNNGTGLAGVDWKCKLMILKGLDSQNKGQYSWWANALYYAVDNGAHIVNMSLGGTSSSTTLQNAVTYAVNNGVLVVVSTGNGNTSSPSYPAACTGAMAVGSTSPDDTRTVPFPWDANSGSNYPTYISVVAPGNYIYGLSHTSNTNYNTYWSGTSQASPHVAGVAALLLGKNKNLTPAQLRNIIEVTAEDKVGKSAEDVTGWDQYHGHGRLNAYNALNYLTTSAFNTSTQYGAQSVVYPQPFSSRATLCLKSSERISPFTVVITDLTGKEVRRIYSESETVSIARDGLSEGLYLYRVIDGENRILSAGKLSVAGR